MKSWNGYQKLYTVITWFSDSVRAGIFVAEQAWVKKECKFIKKITYYMYHKKTLEHGLKN